MRDRELFGLFISSEKCACYQNFIKLWDFSIHPQIKSFDKFYKLYILCALANVFFFDNAVACLTCV